MDLYISKQCKHCAQLLTLLRDNPNLQPYFNIKPIENYPYPKELKVVPTLIKDNQLFTDNELNKIINDVYRFDMEKKSQMPSQQMPSQQMPSQQMPSQQMPFQQMPQQMQDERSIKMQQFANNNKGPQPQKPEDNNDEILGVCLSEECMYESINNDNDNYLNGNYCNLDDGYSGVKIDDKNSKNGEKTGKFDNNAFENMMKSRGAM